MDPLQQLLEKAKGKRLIIVEDDPMSAEALKENLGLFFPELYHAADGETACRLQAEVSADIIVSDLGLPKLGGVELIYALRKIDSNVPLIVASGESSEEVKARILDAGADRYLLKPYRMEILQMELISLL